MFKIAVFSFDARREWFAKAQNRLTDCFIRQIVPDSLHCCIRMRYILWFWFLHVKLTKIIYYHSVFHVNKILCHNVVPTSRRLWKWKAHSRHWAQQP